MNITKKKQTHRYRKHEGLPVRREVEERHVRVGVRRYKLPCVK